MIERVLENWLDSVNERGYEVAFCQALIAHGHTIIRRPTHGPTEHGKDIVTRDGKGALHAYQLKTGNLTKTSWREIRYQVEELVEVPIQEPGVTPASKFTPHLVTNGVVHEPVKDEVRARNHVWGRKYRPLDIISKDVLFRTFLDLQAGLFPTNPVDFEKFLRLYLAEKRGFLPKREFSEFLESFLPSPGTVTRLGLKRILAAAVVFANYVLSGYQSLDNHLAVAEGWMVVVAYLLRTAVANEAKEVIWRASIQLCVEAWDRAAGELVDEAMRPRSWLGTDPPVDGFVALYRKTILTGYLACYALYKRMTTGALPNEGEIFARVAAEFRPIGFWGEGAIPFVMAVVLLLWKHGSEEEAVQTVAGLINLITQNNGTARGLGLPDPYWDSAAVLEELLHQRRAGEIVQYIRQIDLLHGKELPQLHYQAVAALAQNLVGGSKWNFRQTFTGKSFGIRSLVEFLARRERKRLLRSLWYQITSVDYAEFVPERRIDFYLWRAKRGALVTRRFKRPQPWAELVSAANAKPKSRDLPFAAFPELRLPFALVYPHRLTPNLVRSWEGLLR
jgi:hypothetical protein